MSRSQLGLRVLFMLGSLLLVALTVASSPAPVLVAVVALVALTAYAGTRPDSPVVTVLLAGHALHWVMAVPVPHGTTRWVWLLVAAWLGLLVHLSASLSASLPASVAVPGTSLRRWGRRAAVVAAATVPVWLVAMTASSQQAVGQVSVTYAALACVALLLLAAWLLSRDPSP